MNPVLDEPRWKRVWRGVVGFACGVVMAVGVVWASHLGLDDRARIDRSSALDLAAACVTRDGPTSVAYFGGPASPTGWRCARVDGEQWVSEPISPEEGCRLLHGRAARAERADADSPFAWYCRP